RPQPTAHRAAAYDREPHPRVVAVPSAAKTRRGHGLRAFGRGAGVRNRCGRRDHRRKSRVARPLSAARATRCAAAHGWPGCASAENALSRISRHPRATPRRNGLALHAVDAAPPPRCACACGLRALDDAAVCPLRLTLIASTAVAVLAATSLCLLAFGLNLFYLTVRALRLRHPAAPRLISSSEPRVCIQIPVYNERYVVERVIDAVCAIDWPRDRLEVQVLDDSDDETVGILASRVTQWRRKGVGVTQLRRGTRAGFKAGALAYGMAQTEAPFIAIFDADFVPPQDFLRRTIGAFDDPSIAFAQARWGHLDEGYSLFTRLQAMAIDFHFLVEQAVRSARGYFTNFTGTAGVWRRTAIQDAGGWSARTLTEDLDLSYRAQLRGWKAAYLEDLVVPEELPVSMDAYRRQQSRWATGSFQAAFRLMVPVLRSRNRAAVKLQAVVHLLAYSVGPLMLLQLACYPWLIFVSGRLDYPWQLAAVAIWINLVGASPWIGFMVAQTRRGRRWWSGAPSLFCQVVGAGMSFTVLLALFRATRRGGEFIRTPKYQIVSRGQEWRDQAYVRVGDPRVFGEAAIGAAALAMVPLALALGKGVIALYAGIFAIGFVTVAAFSVVELLEV